MTASLLSFCAKIEAAIIAGAVFLGSGSIIILPGFIPTALQLLLYNKPKM